MTTSSADDAPETPPAGPAAHDLTASLVSVDSLALFHKNPREGDTPAILESLQVNGQYKPIVVNRGTLTGRPDEVLAGNHTLIAAREGGIEQLWCVFVDVDDDGAARIVAVDNHTPQLGGMNMAVLADLLGGVDDLRGTSYSFTDLDDMLAELEEAAPADEGIRAGAQTAGDEGDEGEDSGSSGVRTTNTLSEDRENYAERDSRMIILTYSLDEFERVVEDLATLAERFDLGSNSDVVARLVAMALEADTAKA